MNFEQLPATTEQILAEVRELRTEVQQLQKLQPINELPIDRRELRLRLGLSEPTIIELDKKGELGGFNVGGQRRYIWNVVLAKLSQGNHKTKTHKHQNK